MASFSGNRSIASAMACFSASPMCLSCLIVPLVVGSTRTDITTKVPVRSWRATSPEGSSRDSACCAIVFSTFLVKKGVPASYRRWISLRASPGCRDSMSDQSGTRTSSLWLGSGPADALSNVFAGTSCGRPGVSPGTGLGAFWQLFGMAVPSSAVGGFNEGLGWLLHVLVDVACE